MKVQKHQIEIQLPPDRYSTLLLSLADNAKEVPPPPSPPAAGSSKQK